jgi:hypothetical protein
MPSPATIDAFLARVDDDAFAEALERDPLTALRDGGYDELTEAVVEQRDRIEELVDRIYTDDAFRREVEDDPLGRLGDWGLPELAIEPVLVLVGAPDDVVERATADVEAHGLGKKPASIAALAAVLGTLAFAQQASAAAEPARASAQVTAAAANPQLSIQQAPAAATQVAPALSAQRSTTQVRWQGIKAQRATPQAWSILRSHFR